MAIPYTLIRSKRRKKSLSVRVDPSRGVIVSAPYRMPEFFIKKFLEKNAAWITKKQAKPALPPAKRRILDIELEELVRSLVKKHAETLSLHPTAVKFKHVKSYWGSCSRKGGLSFNYRLAYASPLAVEYVVIHELTHLVHKNHSRKFWDTLRNNCPFVKEAKKELRHLVMV